MLIGTMDQQDLSEEVIQAFVRTIWLTTNALELSASAMEPMNERRAAEAKAISTLASDTTNVEDLRVFYKVIHDQVRSVIGNYGFVIALYDQPTNSINIPYLYEDNSFSSLDSFPLGEGLTSILIRTRTLMLVEDTERRHCHGGKDRRQTSHVLARSSFGRGKSDWCTIIQDLSMKRSFDTDDLRFMVSVASQVSSAIHT
jgi:hypothetical protein